ncbi:MAG: HAMP domain-containing protein [Acidobacteria bacterium]|nr:HAMP domain-containing protein [Acidobacteriota bacterium]
MFRTVSFKVAFVANTILLVVMALGTAILVNQQNQRLMSQFVADGKFMSQTAAKAVGRVMEEAIDNGVFTVQDAFDRDYVQIPNFDPPKYHTKYDFYTDKALLALQDEYMKNPNCLYAIVVDANGYLPTHNSKYQQPITGDREKDKAGNRTKRIFNDPVGLAAARNRQEGFVQTYARDTGELALDISSPVMVKGRHWGNFRIGLLSSALDAAKKENLIQSVIFMLGGLLVSTFAVLFTAKIVLRPLTTFTRIAGRMADGDVEEKIVSTSKDEIGALADVLERMRVSMKAAMDRLSRKS